MKANRPHRVPLSGRALDVLRAVRADADGSGLVCPSLCGRVMPGATMSKLCLDHGIDAVPHDFRQRAAGRPNVSCENCEEAPAHVNPIRVEAACRRSGLFERRGDPMDARARCLAAESAAAAAIRR